jgi:hypothetical protein
MWGTAYAVRTKVTLDYAACPIPLLIALAVFVFDVSQDPGGPGETREDKTLSIYVGRIRANRARQFWLLK